MGTNEIHVADVVTTFQVSLLDENGDVFAVNDAHVMNFIFQKPDGSTITREASYARNPDYTLGDGTDGRVEYTTTPEDLDQYGLWRYQVFVAKGPVEKHSDIGKFRVFPNLPLE